MSLNKCWIEHNRLGAPVTTGDHPNRPQNVPRTTTTDPIDRMEFFEQKLNLSTLQAEFLAIKGEMLELRSDMRKLMKEMDELPMAIGRLPPNPPELVRETAVVPETIEAKKTAKVVKSASSSSAVKTTRKVSSTPRKEH